MPPGRFLGAAPSPHLAGLYALVSAEVDVAGLEVVGDLPPELEGCYLRNGPNPRFSPIGCYVYPLDGDGMVHEVQLGSGCARYRNRFVRTPALTWAVIRPDGSASAPIPVEGVERPSLVHDMP